MINARNDASRMNVMLQRPNISEALLPKAVGNSPGIPRFSPKRMQAEAQLKFKDFIKNVNPKTGQPN